jgi:hypothetical protein
MSGLGHSSVIVTIEFMQLNGRVSGDSQHPPKIGIFFISPQHFQISITGNQ